ncbi:PqiC family protein [Pseudomonas sp. G.S.17]|uniref:PqiC family protein n=1 Tax=Pseudomonas sp. G.S.17 TaxID=3137451 RepID=UPI00311CA362
MRATFNAPLLMIVLLLAACRSDPVHYHTLTPLHSGAPRSAQVGDSLRIERVMVPPQVDRSQIVIRQGTNELVLLETEWWGASLADEVQSALINELNNRPGGREKMTLRIEVQRFDLVPGQYALLDARWRMRAGQSTDQNSNELICQTILQQPSGAAVEDLVMAQQANLRKLAIIVSDANRAGATRCP